jgi:WhiB family redox-sensing transcriptional regulator
VCGVSAGDQRPDSWRDQAACLDVDPDLFFPDGKVGPAAQAQVVEAKAVCATCPVLGQCRAWALTHSRLVEYGVFGGLSEDERRAELRRQARRAAGSVVAA